MWKAVLYCRKMAGQAASADQQNKDCFDGGVHVFLHDF
jgi:hypothetical protein